MPPKADSMTPPPRRSGRFIARESIPTSSRSCLQPPSTAVSTSSEFSRQSLDLENSGAERCGPEKIIHVEAATVVGSGDGSKNVASSSSLPVERQHVQSESSVQPVIGTESAAVGVAGSRTRRIKVVRKTVRIVKKVIKKRVPKRVLKNGSESQVVVVKAEDGVNLSEVREKLDIANDFIENSDEVIKKTSVVNEANDILSTADNFTEHLNIVNDVNEISDHMDRETEKTRVIDEAMEKENITDEVKQELKLVHSPNFSEPVVGKKDNDLSGIAYMESEGSKLNSSASFSKRKVPANDSIGINSTEADNIASNDVASELDRNNLTIRAPGLLEIVKVNNNPGTSLKTKEIENIMMANQSANSVVENERIDAVDKDDVELLTCPNVGLVAEKTVVLGEGENGRMIGKAESGTVVDSDRIRLTEGLLLSGEMEALERRKRRKTEVFVGGLDKDTKEYDIRKVFGEAGVIVEVRLLMSRTGKTRGFAFVRFATAADAKNAVAIFSKVEICGKQCNTEPVEGNDTIFIGNIERNWKAEDVVALLEKAGIEKLDRVTLKADPNDIEKNRGFAFVEFQTSKDAQIAFNKLHKKDVFGKQMVKVAWAQPITEPTEEEILQVKSVYAEYLPSSWDEEKVKDYFKRFGEIENVVLAKDLPSSRRKDFAFINYTTRDAALTCIEAVSRERLEDDCSKVKMATSLAKPIKGRQKKHTSDLTSKQFFEEKACQTSKKLHEPRNKEKVASSSYSHVKPDNKRSTTDELVEILRQQASNKNILLNPGTGVNIQEQHFSVPGSKRPYSLVGHDPLYVERIGLSRPCVESSYSTSAPSSSSHGFGLSSFPYHHRQGPGFESESGNERRIYPSHFQTREQAPYYADDRSSIYRRY